MFNCSGRLHGPGLQPEKRLQQAIAPGWSSPVSMPWLRSSGQSDEPLLQRDQAFHFASLSARVGSIGDNRTGAGTATERPAAQNQLLRCLSIEYPALAIGHREPVIPARPTQPCHVPSRASYRTSCFPLNGRTAVGGGVATDQPSLFRAWDGQSIDWQRAPAAPGSTHSGLLLPLPPAHQWCDAILIGLLPSRRTDTPVIPRFQTRELEGGHGTTVIALSLAVSQELLRHHAADAVLAEIRRIGLAETIAIPTVIGSQP